MVLFIAIAALGLNAASASAVSMQMTAEAPMDKVTTLLEDLRTKVESEGEAEANTYNSFACFCKVAQAEKLASIETLGLDKQSFEARLNEAATARDGADTNIQAAVDAIKILEDELEQLQATRHSSALEYETNEVDLTGAVQALTSAIHTLQAARTATAASALMQLRANPYQLAFLRRALQMADILGLKSSRASAALLSLRQDDVPDSQYDFHSDDIITTLEGLKTAFKEQKDQLDQDEVAAKATYHSLVQDKQQAVAEQTTAMEDGKKLKAEKTSLLATTSQDLTTISAQLLDDQAYVKELSSKCEAKATLWDQRTDLRTQELTALTRALEIIKSLSEASLLVVGHKSLRPPAALLQLATVSKHVLPPKHMPKDHQRNRRNIGRRARAVALLRARAAKLKSALLLKVSHQTSADPFAKVKQLIQELVEKLLTEAQNEATHKGWCDQEVGSAEQERDTSAESIQEVNAKLAVGEARIEKLESMLLVLESDMQVVQTELDNSTTLREQEQQENEALIQEAQADKGVVDEAIQVLTEFYVMAANAGNSSLLQMKAGTSNSSVIEDMPDAEFDDVYTGAQSAQGGVVAILEVLASDFERTVSETQKAEELAKQEHIELQTALGATIAAKTEARQARESSLSDATSEDEADRTALVGYQDRLDKSLAELQALQSACFDNGMTAEEAKAKREEEIEALKQALVILESSN